MMKAILITTVTLISIIACKNSQNTTTSASQKDTNPIVFEMERTACFGTCPVYKITFYKNGQATYHGKQHTGKLGVYTAVLPQESIDSTIKVFENARFFDFKDEYKGNMTDFPTTYIRYSSPDGKRTKKITDYYGAPDELKRLEKMLDELGSTVSWTMTEAPPKQD